MHGLHGLCQQTGILHNDNDIATSLCLRAKSVSSTCIDMVFDKEVFVQLLQMIRCQCLSQDPFLRIFGGLT